MCSVIFDLIFAGFIEGLKYHPHAAPVFQLLDPGDWELSSVECVPIMSKALG